MINYLKSKNPLDCCGCAACINVCPSQCLELEHNAEGFLYPKIKEKSCLKCGLCEKVCPFSDNYTFETTANPAVYAAYDRNSRNGSSSGGIFYTIAKYTIEKLHGWVYGAAFDDNFQLRHIGVDNLENLQKLRGSKYVQSNMCFVYSKIKQQLENGLFVFFVGTPCQVAGLRGFLRTKEYDNLLMADVVCHGVPPQTLFDEHVKYLEKRYKSGLVSYQFRKMSGWGGCETAVFANKIKPKILPTYELSPYLYSFMHSMTCRESCYECKFAKIPRQGDITLADFWGVRNCFPEIDDSGGVSMVMVNTHRGRALWNAISDDVVSFESCVADAARSNGNLVSKTTRPDIRSNVYASIKEKGYDKVATTLFRRNHYVYHFLRTIIHSYARNIKLRIKGKVKNI